MTTFSLNTERDSDKEKLHGFGNFNHKKHKLLITIFVESNSNRLNIESDSITSQV